MNMNPFSRVYPENGSSFEMLVTRFSIVRVLMKSEKERDMDTNTKDLR